MKKQLGVGLAMAICVTSVAGVSHGERRWRRGAIEDFPRPVATRISLGLRGAGSSVQALSCGTGAGTGSVKVAYGCSAGGTICFVNVGKDGNVNSAGCGKCGGSNQPSCTPWK
jgi:hypothetical protein